MGVWGAGGRKGRCPCEWLTRIGKLERSKPTEWIRMDAASEWSPGLFSSTSVGQMCQLHEGRKPVLSRTLYPCLTHSRHSVLLFSCSVVSDSLRPHGLQCSRLPWPSPSPGVCTNSRPLSRWCQPKTNSSSVAPSPALNLSQHQSLFQCTGSPHQVTKVLKLQLHQQSFQWIFRIDFL